MGSGWGYRFTKHFIFMACSFLLSFKLSSELWIWVKVYCDSYYPQNVLIQNSLIFVKHRVIIYAARDFRVLPFSDFSKNRRRYRFNTILNVQYKSVNVFINFLICSYWVKILTVNSALETIYCSVPPKETFSFYGQSDIHIYNL